MTTQYKYLSKPDIVQKGDEFKIISNQDVWAPSFRVGQEVINGRYRRPIPVETKQEDCGSITEAQREIIDSERDKQQKDELFKRLGAQAQREVVLNFGGNPPLFVYHTAPDAVGTQQHRLLTLGEAILPTDEFYSPDYGWITVTSLGKVRKADTPVRRLVEQNEAMLDAALSDAIEQRAQNRELKTRLENALKDVVIAEARKDELDRRLVERGNYINNLTARLMDKEQAVDRLSDIVINMINDLGDKGTAIAELTETIREHQMTNRRLEDKLSSHEAFTRHIADALQNLKTALKKLC